MQYSATGTSYTLLGDFEQEDPVDAVRAGTKGFGVDEAFECSGAAGAFNQVVLMGVPPEEAMEELPFKHIVHDQIAIFGSRADLNVARKVIALMSSGQLKISDLITHTFSLMEFRRALDMFVHRRDGAIKMVLPYLLLRDPLWGGKRHHGQYGGKV
jgi:L-iditol 2-dehydrogenase